MYNQFYGFSERPFSLLPDPDFLFLSDKHRAALDTLELAIFNHSGFCVISGAIGAGKTTLIRELLNRLNDDVQVGLVSNTHPSFGELMQWIMAAYGLPADTADPLELHQRFIDYVIQRYAEGKHTLLIIDEAQNLSMGALEELRMLSNVNSEKDLVLQIIMTGQKELREKLRRPELTQFAQRISIDYYLGGLTPDETGLYVQHRVTHAGGAADLFTREACRQVFEYSQGIPRVINRLCDLSLVYGYARQNERIDADVVKAVAQEQHLGATLDAARQRATAPASTVEPVVAAMALDKANDSAAEVFIDKIDSILATGAAQADRVVVEAATATAAGKDEAMPAVDEEVADVPVQETVARTAPEPKSDEIHPGLRPKIAREDSTTEKSALHTLVVNAEKSASVRSERGAMWLLLSVAAMVVLTAWMSRDVWLPVVEDVVAVQAVAPPEPAAPARKAARLVRQQVAGKAKQQQALQEQARREEAARLVRQQAAVKAKQQQALREQARREEAARLARQQAAEKAKQQQALQEQARREKAARLARQHAEEKSRQQQAQQEKARQQVTRLVKQPAAGEAATPAALWADTPEWSDEGDDEDSVKAPAVASPAQAAPQTTAAATPETRQADPGKTPEDASGVFSTNPCNGPTARFLSTCR